MIYYYLSSQQQDISLEVCACVGQYTYTHSHTADGESDIKQ